MPARNHILLWPQNKNTFNTKRAKYWLGYVISDKWALSSFFSVLAEMSQSTFLEHNRTALLLLSELCMEIWVNRWKCHDWLAYRNIVGPGFPVDNSSLTNELRPSLSSMDSGLAMVEFDQFRQYSSGLLVPYQKCYFAPRILLKRRSQTCRVPANMALSKTRRSLPSKVTSSKWPPISKQDLPRPSHSCCNVWAKALKTLRQIDEKHFRIHRKHLVEHNST